MRAPRNEATGTSGESEVLAEFERLGWGGVIDSRHDTGTDLYVRPRDARRFELGVVMGVQVKTGRSQFNAPSREPEGGISGWWFTEDRRDHFDYWVRHALPHLLVLRDQDTDTSYWVHVTAERVVPTGKGAKIFVPASQVIDAGNNQALSDVALKQLETRTWEGTAWTGAVHLSPADEIRYALIAPRLIAPHPNLAPSSITGVEALAMQVLLRPELERTLESKTGESLMPGFEDQWQGLSIDEARESDEWCWRATAALHDRIYNDETTGLLDLVRKASSPSERAASTVLACTVHFESNNPDAALEDLEAVMQHDEFSPHDHAWLEAQRARALLEMGRHEDAFDLAMKTQRIRRQAPHDVTGAAIAGACASTSFRASGWLEGDVANIIQGSDNPVSWWRSQLVSYGFFSHLSDEFQAWAGDDHTRARRSGTADRRLFSTALLSSLAGDHEGWRASTGAFAEMLLASTDGAYSPDAVADRLDMLRLSGDSKAVAAATRHVVALGPAGAARIAAERITLSRSTRTSALADLELLTAAGDVLSEAHADDVCAWALATLTQDEGYRARTRPTFAVFYKVVDLLRSMLLAMSDESVHRVINYFLDLPPVSDGPTAQTLARLVREIPGTAWTKDERVRAAERSKTDAAYLSEAYLRVAATTAEDSREEVHKRARAGDLMVLDAVSDVRDLPEAAAAALIESLSGAVNDDVRSAKSGYYGKGGLDAGRALTILNVWHPSDARWDPIGSLLSEPSVVPYLRQGALEMLALHGSRLPVQVREQFLPPLAVLRAARQQLDDPEHNRALSLATEAFAALADEPERKELVRELLGGDVLDRSVAARVIERHEDASQAEFLLALAGDDKEMVRTPALAGLASLAAAGNAPASALTVLARHLQSGGKRSASAIVSRLTKRTPLPGVSALLEAAADHPSARIRSMVRNDG